MSRTAGEELAFTSATALATAIRTGALSPVEVMDATLARIEARNFGPTRNLFDVRYKAKPSVSIVNGRFAAQAAAETP